MPSSRKRVSVRVLVDRTAQSFPEPHRAEFPCLAKIGDEKGLLAGLGKSVGILGRPDKLLITCGHDQHLFQLSIPPLDPSPDTWQQIRALPPIDADLAPVRVPTLGGGTPRATSTVAVVASVGADQGWLGCREACRGPR